MVPKLHVKGKSFRGLAAYLLHDKERAKTAQRVEWTETLNLATENPHAAWKVMAATAMKQDELKATAKVKATGRKSPDSVLHLSLAWHPDQKGQVSREEMMACAVGALKALGAQDRQAMVICHGDERQPHVHVVVNRVSPEDGRMLSSSKEKLNLSKWAESYEKEQGHVYCEERVINNAARDRKKHTRGKKDRPRHLHEAEQKAELDPKTKEALRQKEAELARRARQMRGQQKKAWAEMERQHKQRAQEIRTQAAKETMRQKDAIRAQMKPEFQTLYQKHRAGMAQFLEREKSLLGRVHNALRSIDYRAILRGEAVDKKEGLRRGTLGQAFDALSKAGVRLEALKRQQEKEKRGLEARENRAEREAEVRIRQERKEALQRNRERYEKERHDMIAINRKMDGAKLRAERLSLSRERETAWEELRGRAANQQEKPSPPEKIHDRFERQSGDRFERGPDRRGRN